MVRIRSRETSLVGILAALAVLGQIGSAPAQTYSVVGQSSSKTAATGRRPIAERIKAANRPIRIKAEADLAPDEGLIRDLSATDAAVREWTPEPPVVEFAEAPTLSFAGEPATEVATAQSGSPAAESVVTPAAEPAVVPPPVEDAIAANPTTAEDDDAVGEVAALENASGEETVPEGVNAAGSAAPPVASPPRNVAPPRRAPARVTPERREALLGRLRAALAEMPRPFGLVPMPHPAPTQHRPRPAMRRLPAPVAVKPVPTAGETGLEPAPAESVPASTPDTAAIATDEQAPVAVDDVTPGTVADRAAVTEVPETFPTGGDAPLADADATLEPSPAPVLVTTEASADETAIASDATAPGTPGTTEIVMGDETTSSAEPGIATTDTPTTPVVDESAAADLVDAGPSTGAATTGNAGTRTGGHHRTAARPIPNRSRAPQSIVQRQRPLERLQATIESLPRPLGILPAPRPAVRSQMPQSRAPATVARGVPRAPAGEPRTLASVPPAQPALGSAPTEHDVEAVASTLSGDDGVTPDRGDAPTTADGLEVPATLAEAPPEAPCIEVTVEGPEGKVARGDRVTLRLTVRNTGTVAARAVAPMFHFGLGIEPMASAGRVARLTDEGSVVFESLPELAPGETVEVDVVAVCDTVGAVPFQAVVWCGEGDQAEQVPVDGRLIVVPARVATAPDAAVRR